MKITGKINTTLKLWGLMFTLCMTVILYATFLVVFFAQDKMAIISVDSHGEGLIEFIVIPVSLGFAVAGHALIMKDVLEEPPPMQK